jgi:hypothetical protein
MTIADHSEKENSGLCRDSNSSNDIKEKAVSDNKTAAQLQNLDKESQTLVIEQEDCVVVSAADREHSDIEDYSIKVLFQY